MFDTAIGATSNNVSSFSFLWIVRVLCGPVNNNHAVFPSQHKNSTVLIWKSVCYLFYSLITCQTLSVSRLIAILFPTVLASRSFQT